MAKRYVKKNKVKLSREQQRQRAAARMAKKRAEDPAYCANEASKMAQKRVNPSYRKKEAVVKAKKRRNTSYRNEENKRNKKRKKIARKTTQYRKAADPKGYINNKIIQLISNWKDCEAGLGDLHYHNNRGQHYLGKMLHAVEFVVQLGLRPNFNPSG